MTVPTEAPIPSAETALSSTVFILLVDWVGVVLHPTISRDAQAANTPVLNKEVCIYCPYEVLFVNDSYLIRDWQTLGYGLRRGLYEFHQ